MHMKNPYFEFVEHITMVLFIAVESFRICLMQVGSKLIQTPETFCVLNV